MLLYDREDVLKYTWFVDARPSTAFTQGYGFVTISRTLSESPEFDLYVTVPLQRTYAIHEYVDIKKDDTIQPIPRQEINPLFYEYSFFDDIKRNKINNGSDLTIAAINFILSKRSDLTGMTNSQVMEWFDYVGKNELPWKLSEEVIKIDDIERSQTMLENIVSRSGFFGIDINTSD